MIKCGVIGTGIMGKSGMKAFRQFAESEPVAVCDLNEKTAKEVAEEFGVTEVYTDYNEMLEKSDLDMVYVATPDFAHRDPVVKSLEAGKHVLVEKPFATSIEDADAMVAAADKASTKLMVNFSNRFFPPHHQTKQAIQEGTLGEMRYAYARLSNTTMIPRKMLSWAGQTTGAWFLFPHSVDIVRWFFDSEATEVYAMTTEGLLKSEGLPIPDTTVALVRFENGAAACFENVWIMPESLPTPVDHYLQLFGTKGMVTTDMRDNTYKRYSEKAEYPRCFSWQTMDGIGKGFFYDNVYHFLMCVLDPSKKTINDQHDGRANTEIIEAIHRSAKEGKPITLPLK